MSSSNRCFLTHTRVSQKISKEIWHSHFFKNFPQFVLIHTVKGFSMVNEPEVNVFYNSVDFSMIQQMMVTWSLVPLPHQNPVCTPGSSWLTKDVCVYWTHVLYHFEEINCVMIKCMPITSTRHILSQLDFFPQSGTRHVSNKHKHLQFFSNRKTKVGKLRFFLNN